MIQAAIVGGTGYTGVELVRSIITHPGVELAVITSRTEEGLPLSELYPSLRGRTELCFTQPDIEQLAECDVVFFATPHTVAMNMMAELINKDVRVIDLSADFRLDDLAVWEQWYGHAHSCPEVVKQAVYGLPELNRERIKQAKLVAAPGCYPTAVQLGFLPLLKAAIIDPQHLIASAVSGVSGAGRSANVDNLYAEVNDSFKSYGVAGHRHLPEIEQQLTKMASGPVNLTFVPHLAPMTRGIQATLFASLKSAEIEPDALQNLFEESYQDEPFVDVLPAGQAPQTRSVRGSNQCRISVFRPQDRDTVVVLSVIDNLVKGASGQAIQAMNIMFGFDEDMGIAHLALLP